MNATFMATIPTFDVGTHFNIPLYKEEATEIAGVTADVPSPLYAYADKLRDEMNACGQILLKLGHLDFAAFVLDALEDAPCTAEMLCQAFISTFPFHGVSTALAPHTGGTAEKKDSQEEEKLSIQFHQTAVRLTSELHHRFKDRDERFRFEDAESIPPYVDNHIISILLHLGVVLTEEDNEKKPSTDDANSNEILQSPLVLKYPTEMRVAIMEACQVIQSKLVQNFEGHNYCISAAQVSYFIFIQSKSISNNQNSSSSPFTLSIFEDKDRL